MILKPLDRESIALGLRERQLTLGTPLHYEFSTGSTNSDALARAAHGAPPGSLFLCEEQTQGRGRQGRAWWSRPGESLTFSLLLRPQLAPHALPQLCLIAGLAVHRGVRALLGQSPAALQIKWPNDVLLDGRKLAGILVESTQSAATTTMVGAPAVVVGIGINVNQSTLSAEDAPGATSLALATGGLHSRERLLVQILAELEACLAGLERHGFAQSCSELRQLDALKGRAVRVGQIKGTAAGIDAEGRLLLETTEGISPILAGHVEFVGSAEPLSQTDLRLARA